MVMSVIKVFDWRVFFLEILNDTHDHDIRDLSCEKIGELLEKARGRFTDSNMSFL